MNSAAAALYIGVTLAAASGTQTASPLQEGTRAFEHSDYLQAEKLLLPLAKQGNAQAMGLIGEMYLIGQIAGHNQHEGAAWLQKAADLGDPSAETVLGFAYLRGSTIIPEDPKAASRWFEAAAKFPGSESADAKFYLAELYDSGRGVRRNAHRAQQLYASAADGYSAEAAAGMLRAKLRLASMYAHGLGVPKSRDRADQLYKEAAATCRIGAERGDPSMQMTLGDLYAAGDGVPPDEAQAFIWMRRAADQGNVAAMARLALFYTRLTLPKGFLDGAGETDEANYKQSSIWERLARIYAPHRQMAEPAEPPYSPLTPKESADVEAFVRAWRPVRETPAVAAEGPVTPAQASEFARLQRERGWPGRP